MPARPSEELNRSGKCGHRELVEETGVNPRGRVNSAAYTALTPSDGLTP